MALLIRELGSLKHVSGILVLVAVFKPPTVNLLRTLCIFYGKTSLKGANVAD